MEEIGDVLGHREAEADERPGHDPVDRRVEFVPELAEEEEDDQPLDPLLDDAGDRAVADDVEEIAHRELDRQEEGRIDHQRRGDRHDRPGQECADQHVAMGTLETLQARDGAGDGDVRDQRRRHDQRGGEEAGEATGEGREQHAQEGAAEAEGPEGRGQDEQVFPVVRLHIRGEQELGGIAT